MTTPRDEGEAPTRATPGVLVQVRQPAGGTATPQSFAQTLRKLDAKDFDALTALAREIEGTIFGALKTGDHIPTKLALEFGLDVGGEAGVPFVTKGTIGANFKISLEWTLGDAERDR
jgi:hypothetical protein